MRGWMPWAATVAASMLTGCASLPKPEVREGPPVEVAFRVPAGRVLIEQYVQRRQARVEFFEGDPQQVWEVLAGSIEERYEPLGRDGWRVVSTVVDETVLRNGERISSPLPLTGVALVHRIDAQGRFVAGEELEMTVAELHRRIRDDRLRELLEKVITVEWLQTRLEQTWTRRTQQVCGATLAPGDELFVSEDQELPVGGPVRALVRQTVLGTTGVRSHTAVELALTLGGGTSPLVELAGAASALDEVPGGVRGLTPKLEGKGERLVDVATCQTLREQVQMKGELRVNQEAARTSGATGFPKRIRFEVTRELVRAAPGDLPVLPRPS